MAVFSGPEIVNDGLVLQLDAANPRSYPGSGTTWSDLSGNANNGTLVNGVGYSSDNAGYLTFDGVDDYVSIGYGGYLSSSTDRTEITIDCWVIVTSLGSDQVFFQVGGYLNAAVLGCLTNNKIRFLVRKGGDTVGGIYDDYLDSSLTIIDNVWYHIVASKTPSTMSLYINGIADSSISTSFVWNTGGDTPVWIGRNNTQSALTGQNLKIDEFVGNMSSIQIYNRGISEIEALQNFEAMRSRYGI